MNPHIDDLITKTIVLYDGECSFCNGAAAWIIDRDQQGTVSFAALQGTTGQALLAYYNIPQHIDSMICIDRNKAFLYSSGPIRAAKHLDGAWKLLYCFMMVPAFIRDPFYRWFAKNRIRWFGKQQACLIPTPDIRRRFLD